MCALLFGGGCLKTPPLWAAVRKKPFLPNKAGLRAAPGRQGRGDRARNFLEGSSRGTASSASRAALLFVFPGAASGSSLSEQPRARSSAAGELTTLTHVVSGACWRAFNPSTDATCGFNQLERSPGISRM